MTLHPEETPQADGPNAPATTWSWPFAALVLAIQWGTVLLIYLACWISVPHPN